MSDRKAEFYRLAVERFGTTEAYKNREMLDFVEGLKNFEKKDWNWVFRPDFKVARGEYRLPTTLGLGAGRANPSPMPATSAAVAMTLPAPAAAHTANHKKFDPNALSEYDHAVVPDRDGFYVPFGEFKDVEQIIKAGVFFPVFISGMSGNGKTFMVEQACARAKRRMVRVQMSPETDEDDLIGGFRLIEGETKFMKGPVLRAMEEGALLLIDEADRANPGKVMCLQGVLEGKQYYVKKTGEVIKPQPGFNIIVTANTKGKGSDDGRYVAAGILDDAWLERFPITVEQNFPPANIETRILMGYMAAGRELTEEDRSFVKNLISWGDITRKTFFDGAIDELISTRRLVHIIQTYKMFGDRKRAIALCTNRFDNETKNAFLELYTKVDATVSAGTQTAAPEQPETTA